MKVIFDFRIFSRQRHGGISRYFFEVARNLQGVDGIDASICAPFYVNHYLREGGLKLSRGIYLKKLPQRAVRTVERMNELLSHLAFSLEGPDILHETYYSERGLAPKGAITVTTVYDMIHEIFPELFPGDETARLKAASVKRADHIFCISAQTQADLVRILRVDPRKTSVVHLGCDFGERSSGFGAAPPVEGPYLLFVGPRGAHKNFRVLLEAYSMSGRLQRDFKLICFGSTPFSPGELAGIRELGLSPEKVLHASGEDDRLPAYYANASVFIYPSLYEGFGFPPLEAMSLGCPTVASRAGSMPEVLGDATEYFPAENAAALVEALEKVAYSAERRAELARLGKRRVEKYRWDTCAKKTLEVYQYLMRERGSAP